MLNDRFKIYFFIIFALFCSCVTQEKNEIKTTNLLFTQVNSEFSGVNFINRSEESIGRNIGSYDYFYNGSGLAIADLNGDFLPDLFFCGNDVPNKIFFNEGNLKFQDVTSDSGIKGNKWSTGVTVVDINNDGLKDLYICNSGPDYKSQNTRNQLYINLGDGKFEEKAADYGIDNNGLSTQAAFFDMDLDGDLDLWIINHSERNWANSAVDWLKYVDQLEDEEKKRFSNSLYKNNGQGKFDDISHTIPKNQPAFGLGISISDFNRDGLPDVFIANDYFLPDRMYINKGSAGFSEESERYFSHNSFYSMGSDAADFNNDGWMDLAVLDMTPSDRYRNKMLMSAMNVDEFKYITEYLEYTPQYMFNSLYLNNSTGVMSDIGHMSGVAKTDWSWAPLLADYDNDGDKDLYVSNGIKRDVKNNDWRLKLLAKKNAGQLDQGSYFESLSEAESTPISNQLFINQDNLLFDNETKQSGLEFLSFSNGAAYGDLDLDGDLDLVINNIDQEAFLFRNNSTENGNTNYCNLTLTDSELKNRESNALVLLISNYDTLYAENTFTRGYQSYCNPAIHFGISELDSSKTFNAIVRWSNGQCKMYENISISKEHVLDYSGGKKIKYSFTENKEVNRSFWNISKYGIQPEFFHQENDFDDFESEVLLPHKQSMLGPGLSVGDVNGDLLDDFFIGGAKDQIGTIYLQSEEGYFNEKVSNDFIKTMESENLGAEFLDVDQDGDLDLYLANGGGGEFEADSKYLQDLLYINDGKGNFKNSKLPTMISSTQCIEFEDWDEDGDLDLFIGGRNVPGEYPLNPRSYFLENDNGSYSIRQENELGMVTDALFFDLNQDGKKEIILVGEWMNPSVLVQKSGSFVRSQEVYFENQEGWWYHINKGDLDGDGDEDLLLGNLGLNNKFHPSLENPLYLFLNDMDKSGSLDIILSQKSEEGLYPIRGRQCSSVQMPFIADSFPDYHSFASSELSEIYGEQMITEAFSLNAINFESIQLTNEGNGKWSLKKLSPEFQLAPIKSSVVYDFNGDSKNDLIIAGNQTQTEVETTPYDAGKGLLAFGKEGGVLQTELLFENSGIFMPGDVVNLKMIYLGSEKAPAVLCVKNNSRLNLFLWNEAEVKK